MTDKKLFWTAVNLLNDVRGFTAIVDYCDELYADGVQGLTKEDCDKCGEEYHFHMESLSDSIKDEARQPAVSLKVAARSQLQQAVIFKEILDRPLALRDPTESPASFD